MKKKSLVGLISRISGAAVAPLATKLYKKSVIILLHFFLLKSISYKYLTRLPSVLSSVYVVPFSQIIPGFSSAGTSSAFKKSKPL